MAFTEFCCRSGGSNMNGGALASNAEPATTPVYSATNGGWNSATGVFTPTSGNPSATVTVGDFAHVFTDGSTTPTRVARVTAVNSTTVTLSTTIGTGTAPTTAGTGISINVGGAWLGPNGAVGFPFNFMNGVTVNSSSNRMRVNIKNDQTYNVTASMDVNIGSSGLTPITYQGYTTTFGDGGRATIDGGTTGASYNVLVTNNNAVTICLADLIFDHNGATGTTSLVNFVRGEGDIVRCTFRNAKGSGASCQFGNGYNFISCDSYLNGSNGFFNSVIGTTYYNCVASRNTSAGFQSGSIGNVYVDCLAVGNAIGFYLDQCTAMCINCNAYSNTGEGFYLGSRGAVDLINCNAVSNTTWGVNFFGGSTPKTGNILNCGFFGNTSGTINTGINNGTVISGSVNYGSTPFTDAANGDFRLGGAGAASAKEAGYGVFQWNDTNYSARANNVSFPDIGMIQAQSTGGGTTAGQRVING